jgi:hypothetical protein
VQTLGRSCVLAGIGSVLAACIVMLWPLHANGVSDMALRPHYNEYFSFTTYEQLPDHPTNDDLRHAGVRRPVDVVWRRRHIAEILAGTGVVLAAAGWARCGPTRDTANPNRGTTASRSNDRICCGQRTGLLMIPRMRNIESSARSPNAGPGAHELSRHCRAARCRLHCTQLDRMSNVRQPDRRTSGRDVEV